MICVLGGLQVRLLLLCRSLFHFFEPLSVLDLGKVGFAGQRSMEAPVFENMPTENILSSSACVFACTLTLPWKTQLDHESPCKPLAHLENF